MKSAELVKQFNAAFPVGTPVRVYPAIKTGHYVETRTRTAAQLLHGTPVIWVQGAPGCFALSHVEVIR